MKKILSAEMIKIQFKTGRVSKQCSAEQQISPNYKNTDNKDNVNVI